MGGSSSHLEVQVKTGQCIGADTDANVRMLLYDDAGQASETLALSQRFRNNFENKQIDVFKVQKESVSNFRLEASIARIEVWTEQSGLGSDWFVDSITVQNWHSKSSFCFPIFRWIRSGRRYRFVHLDTSLPQADLYPEQRKLQLEEKRKDYEYEQHLPDGPVQIKNVPPEELFSFEYKWDIGREIVQLKINSQIEKKAGFVRSCLSKRKLGEFSSFDDLQSYYDSKYFPPPLDFNSWRSDVAFGYQRTCSVNPQVIKLATEIPDKFPVTDDLVEGLLEGITLNEAMDQKRLFLCDYEIMDAMPTKWGFKICSPIGLFFVNTSGDLVPIAIQLFQRSSADNPIFTPKDSPLLWCLVKMWYNNADGNHHQSLTHLGLTHLLMEGVTVATHRNLSESHPIFKIMAPHFLYLIAINALALTDLIPPGGFIDTYLNASSYGALHLLHKGFNTWTMDVNGTLPEDLKRRGVDDPNVLPNYHFREDAMELYNIIHKYVNSYVNLYYTSNELLKEDHEIQSWAGDLVAERGSRGLGLKGVPGNGQLDNVEDLVQIVTCVIYTCSVAHAAVNFPQYHQYGYPPNHPLLMRGCPPTSKDMTLTEEDLLKYLPDENQLLNSIIIAKVLSTKGTLSLGDFEVQYIFDPPALAIVDEFQKDLKEVEKNIEERNKKRTYKYDYLNPKFIPNSISI